MSIALLSDGRSTAPNSLSVVEAILFSAGKPVSIRQVASALKADVLTAKRMVMMLRSQFEREQRGVSVLWDGEDVSLILNPQFADVIGSSRAQSVEHSYSLIEEFLSAQRQRGRRPRTIKSYRLFFRRFAREVGASIDAVTTSEVRRFLMREEVERGNKMSTIASKTHRLKSLYGWFEREELVEKNPMVRIDAPTEGPREPRHLSNEELELVRMSCRNLLDKVLVEVLYSSGIRRDEAVSLDWSDIGWESKSLNVRGG